MDNHRTTNLSGLIHPYLYSLIYSYLSHSNLSGLIHYYPSRLSHGAANLDCIAFAYRMYDDFYRCAARQHFLPVYTMSRLPGHHQRLLRWNIQAQ